MRKKLLIALGVVLGLLIVVPTLIPSDSIRQAAEDAASDAAGVRVTIAKLTLRILPSPGVSIRDVAMHDVKGGTPRLTVESGVVTVAFLPLLAGKVETTGITFRNIALRVSEKAKGKDVHTIHINRVTGSVKLSTDKLVLARWKAKLYDGTLRLDASVAPLKGKKRTLSGRLHVSDIRMYPLLRDAAGQKALTGELSSELRFFANGAPDRAMQHSLKIDGPVRLRDGRIEGVGLEGVAIALVHGKVGARNIVYEKLDLILRVRGREMLFRDITMVSSALNAKGEVRVAADRKLKGSIETKGSGVVTGTKLLVGGTMDSPRIYPAPSSMIGGVVGGAVGGPVGATIGSKIGGKAGDAVTGIKKLFGGKKK